MSIFSEFKKFAMRGNVIDMAVGVIIGASFSSIVTSLVNDVIMPPIGMILGRVNFSDLTLALQEKTIQSPPVIIKYGAFINTIVNFIIIAFVLFILIKQINRFKGPEVATTKQCSFCDSTVSAKATRCPHCTSQLI